MAEKRDNKLISKQVKTIMEKGIAVEQVQFVNSVQVGRQSYNYLNAKEHDMLMYKHQDTFYAISNYTGFHGGCPWTQIRAVIFADESIA